MRLAERGLFDRHASAQQSKRIGVKAEGRDLGQRLGGRADLQAVNVRGASENRQSRVVKVERLADGGWAIGAQRARKERVAGEGCGDDQQNGERHQQDDEAFAEDLHRSRKRRARKTKKPDSA